MSRIVKVMETTADNVTMAKPIQASQSVRTGGLEWTPQGLTVASPFHDEGPLTLSGAQSMAWVPLAQG